MKYVGVKCKTHPLYKATRAPKSFCEPCWRIWIAMQDSTPEQPNSLYDLRRQLGDAGDRHDWDECNRLERKIFRLKKKLGPVQQISLMVQHNSTRNRP